MLFAAATEAKQSLQFKFLWVRNCTIFMRQMGQSDPIKILKEEDIAKLFEENT